MNAFAVECQNVPEKVAQIFLALIVIFTVRTLSETSKNGMNISPGSLQLHGSPSVGAEDVFHFVWGL
jgi:hypothetical protein